MEELKRTARFAGLLYLLVTFTGIFSMMYVPNKIFVRGDLAATAASIRTHAALFQANIVVSVISELLFIGVVLVLYRLLKDVDRWQAMLMVLLVVLPAPLAFLTMANEMTMLELLGQTQKEAMAMMLFQLNHNITVVCEVFWGLWLLPLAYLVFRSGFLPRILGGWLGVNGVAYVALAFTGMLAPQYAPLAMRVAMPALLGEVALTLWLLIVGARPKQSAVVPAPSFG